MLILCTLCFHSKFGPEAERSNSLWFIEGGKGGGSRSRFTENKTVLAQFTKNKGIMKITIHEEKNSHFTFHGEKKGPITSHENTLYHPLYCDLRMKTFLRCS